MPSVFTYGSLMFPEVIEIILDRPIAPDELKNGVLEGYRRVAIPSRPYPTGIRAAGFRIEGKILGPITDEELQRLDKYEESFYIRIPVSVSTRDGPQAAVTYIDGREKLLFALQDWNPKIFHQEHLSVFLKKLRKRWPAQMR